MKAPILIFLLVFSWHIGFSQNQVIDSLKHELGIAKSDTSRALLMAEIAEYYNYNFPNPDSSLIYAQQALTLARKTKFPNGEFRGYYNIGFAFGAIGNYPRALEMQLKALRMAEKHGFWNGKAEVLLDLANSYRNAEDYPKALTYLKQSRQISDSLHVYAMSTMTLSGTARIYWLMNQIDSAQHYAEMCFDNINQYNLEWLRCLNFLGLGRIQQKKENYQLALDYFRKSVTYNSVGNYIYTSQSYLEMARIFQKTNQPDSSVFYANKSLANAQQANLHDKIVESSLFLAGLYEKKDALLTIQFYQIAVAAQEKLTKFGSVNAMQNQIAFNEEERLFEIETAKTAWQSKLRQYALLAGLGVFLLIAFILYRNNRQKQKANAVLKEQKEKVEQTNLALQAANRDARIESALERVRSRAMAMHKSEELGEAAELLYKELQNLGISDFINCGYLEIDEQKQAQHGWMTNSEGIAMERFYLPLVGEPVLDNRYAAWKRQDPVFCQTVGGDLLKAHLQFVNPRLGSEEVVQHAENNFPDATIFYCGNFSHGYLCIITGTLFTAEKEALLARFTKVFEQTYTRFLDLQKAEAQAREAQIEVALERVRARAMAMQKSNELAGIVDTVFRELIQLDIRLDRCIIMVNDTNTGGSTWWLSNPEPAAVPVGFFVKYHEHKPNLDYIRAWQDRTLKWEYVLEGTSKKEWDAFLFTETELSLLPAMVIEGMKSAERIFLNVSFNNFGSLTASSFEPLSEEQFDILIRFAKVFEQTYTRFLDLQKAETRAIEAARTASLDRVRGEIASMRTTDDLQRITPLVWRELTTLGVPFFRCGVFIMDEGNETVHTYLSTPEGKSLAVMHLPFEGAETTRQTVEHWRKQEVYADFWDKEQFAAWAHSMAEQGYVKEEKTYQGGEEPPESLSLQFVPFKQGMLYVGSLERLSMEQIDLVQKLADTFAVAYARYEDFTKLEEAKTRVESTLTELKSTQAQLIQSEKLASLGELTAGIAHEIQNPLNFVNNFSELNRELLSEMKEELAKGNIKEGIAIAGDLEANEERINHHGQRASAIVKGMLEHSRTSSGVKEPTDLNALADEYLRLAYHGLRAKDKDFNADYELLADENLPKINVIPQDIGRVLLNLINNAFWAVHQRDLETLHATSLQEPQYQPTVAIFTQKIDNQILIKVKDNGPGIPDAIRDKIFQPFFTTKPTGQGTGLGLSLSYDIIKAHGGELNLETKEGEGSTFTIQIPLS